MATSVAYRRVFVALPFAATLAACANVLGIGDLALVSDDAGEGAVSVDSSVTDAVGSADVPVDESATDAVERADVTTESGADASSGDAGVDATQDAGVTHDADVTHDAAVERLPACGPSNCAAGCCGTDGLCHADESSSLCGLGGKGCVSCLDSSAGHVCMPSGGTCGCTQTTDCPPGLACQTANYCGPGP